MTENFGKLVYGFTNQTVNILSNINGTFCLEFSYLVGATSKSIKMDKEGLYYNAIAFDDRLYTFYHCPTGCANCSFPNNCSVCEEGYVLKGVYCFPRPT